MLTSIVLPQTNNVRQVHTKSAMIILQGKNLCERQKELNFKVKEAIDNKVEFEEVKLTPEESDVDRLFKIDLASKQRNIDYIIEQLKCGDSLYISRALKCEWLYGKDYAQIINPDSLHHNIFPAMSLKMKTKTLIAISLHVRDETRAQLFFEYCAKTDMTNNAYKFLVFTSDSFKEEYLTNEDRFHEIYDSRVSPKDLIGKSFRLADIYGKHGGAIINLSYLYTINNEKFLNLLEKYTKPSQHYFYYDYNYDTKMGSKMSQNILKKHKSRILEKPLLYVTVLKYSELIKHSSSEDAQVYAVALLPDNANQFWSMNYYKTYKYIFDLVKTDSMYTFIKRIFSDKYPGEKFEMSKMFYELKYFDFMTVQEREAWALLHLDKPTGVIPEDEDYRWYEFLEWKKAFKDIREKIYLTTSAEKRSAMLNTLIKSARTQNELEELLSYYYKRHVNERKDLKENFLKNVIVHHNMFELNDTCWNAFDQLLHSINLYTSIGATNYYIYYEFFNVSVVYHIITKRTFPNGLKECLTRLYLNYIKILIDPLSAEKRALVYDYIFDYFLDKLKDLENFDYNNEVQSKARNYLKKMIEWKRMNGKGCSKEDDFPEIVVKYLKLDKGGYFDYIVRVQGISITHGFLIRCLKNNPSVIFKDDLFSKKIIGYQNSDARTINILWRKIKLYFSNDLAKQCLDLCTASLNKPILELDIFVNVFAIFQLGDERFKSEFMDKYAPANDKIEHDKIDRRVLRIQEAICRFHCYSRPPVPLSKTALYLKGDYVHMMRDMFEMYLKNLPPTLRSEFINWTLDSPVSIQKRGLRLAFQIFEPCVLKAIVSKVWEKTKNISVRNNLYKLILTRINKEKGKSQEELVEVLKHLTLRINENDDEEVFQCFRGNQIPEHLRGSFLENAWKTVVALPEKKSNIERRAYVVNAMEENMSLMDEILVESLIADHVYTGMFDQKLSAEKNPDMAQLDEALWDFVVKYIGNMPNEYKQEKSLNVVKVIVNECINHWNDTNGTEDFVVQNFFHDFNNKLHFKTFWGGINYPRVIYIYKYLLETFEEKFGIAEMYSYYWDWKLSLLTRTVMADKDHSDKPVHIDFGVHLGMLVRELKERHCYYSSFIHKIHEKTSKYIDILNSRRAEALTEHDVTILIAYGLIQSGLFEACVLALTILPIDLTITPTSENELRELIKNVKERNNVELSALINDKFIYSDRKVRKIFL